MNTRLQSTVAWDDLGLARQLVRAVRRLDFTAPTEVQVEAIPKIVSGRDVVVSARTGSGKTAAFLLPIVQGLLEQPSRGLRALIISPTRELAVQIERMLYSIAKDTRVRGYVVYGGVSISAQRHALLGRLEVLVATPGRLLDHVRRGNVNFDLLDYLVLDEADRMLDMGFLPDVQTIISILPRRRQTLMFSATIPREVEQLAKQIMHDPVRIIVGKQDQPPETIRHVVYQVPQHLKARLLIALLRQQGWKSVLVFTGTRWRADQLAGELTQAGLNVGVIHGDRSQNQREAALGRFRAGRHRILVATDVAARGLDISGITHIVNFDVPDNPTSYIHRVGRTARVEASGEAVTLVSSHESRDLKMIEQELGYSFNRERLSGFDYEARPPPRRVQPRPEQADRAPPQRRFGETHSYSRGREGRPPRRHYDSHHIRDQPQGGPQRNVRDNVSSPRRFEQPHDQEDRSEDRRRREGYSASRRKKGKHRWDWRVKGSRQGRFR